MGERRHRRTYWEVNGGAIRPMNRFAWWSGTPYERAEMIRRHYQNLPSEKVCDLFELTPEGLGAIVRGADWKPEFERPAINYVEDFPHSEGA